MLARLGRWCFVNRRIVVGVWIASLVGVWGLYGVVGSGLQDRPELLRSGVGIARRQTVLGSGEAPRRAHAILQHVSKPDRVLEAGAFGAALGSSRGVGGPCVLSAGGIRLSQSGPCCRVLRLTRHSPFEGVDRFGVAL